MKEKCIVVDLEGTLSNCDHRKHFLDDNNFDLWNNGLTIDEPIHRMIDFVAGLAIEYKIIISTAKPSVYRPIVDDWLAKNAPGIPVKQIYMRGSGDMSSSPNVKSMHIVEIMREYEIAAFIDDRVDCCEMASGNGLTILIADATCDLHPYWKELMPGYQQKEKLRRSVREILEDGATFFNKRAEEYGTAYLRHGPIMSAFFPDGIELKTADDFYQWHIFELQIIKMNRIASAMMRGENHPDSHHDIMVYAAMATEGLEAKNE